MKKIPVNIISGFLGSGKTTAIIRLLKSKTAKEHWAVIINEFGKISIDGQTLQSSSDAGTVFDIAGGCICCSARGYFQENLEKIIQSEKFDRIIIEPSGLGGIEMVTEIIETKPDLDLMPSICLVDITTFGNPRFQLNMIYRTQINKAEIIVFSKCDLLADPEAQLELANQFKTAFPEKYAYISGIQLSPDILQTDIRNPKEKNNYLLAFVPNPSLTDQHYREKHFIFSDDQVFDSSKLSGFFLEHPQIIRAKGHIQTEKGWRLVNYTLSGCIFEACETKQKNEIVIIAEKEDQFWSLNLDAKLQTICI